MVVVNNTVRIVIRNSLPTVPLRPDRKFKNDFKKVIKKNYQKQKTSTYSICHNDNDNKNNQTIILEVKIIAKLKLMVFYIAIQIKTKPQ